MKIVVLAGGLSTERQVALTSGTGVCRALRERGHKAILVDMFLGLEDYEGALEDIFDAPDGLCGQSRVERVEPDLEAVRRSRRDQSPSLLGKDVLTVCRMADVVFLALHGSCGEDGRIQATLDLLGVPYTGSGYLGSGMAMDKSVTKRMMDSLGIRTAPWHDIHYTESDIPRLAEELQVPCAVKIVNGGSSIGVALPDTKEQLEKVFSHILEVRMDNSRTRQKLMKDAEVVRMASPLEIFGDFFQEMQGRALNAEEQQVMNKIAEEMEEE